MMCEEIKFKLDGICDLKCFGNILETMERVDGVAETSIELDSKIATMQYEPNRIGPDEIRNIIETIGESDFKITDVF